MREFSFRAIIVGVLVGALLAAANAFVGLKVGLVISASIPAAVVALVVMRKGFKTGTILESNMVQTIGSAGESVASGMIFTLPALFIMGTNPAYWSMVIWGAIGGLLGVCFMVPLRRILIVNEQENLPYPEGVACAEVLESGEKGGVGAKAVIKGAVVGGVYSLFGALGFWRETGTVAVKPLRTEMQLDSSPALLGVGYILGVRVAAYMLAGAFLGWFVLIPIISVVGADSTTPVYPATSPISSMTPSDVHEKYVKYIGAGAVAIGGLISLFKSIPTIFASLWHMLTGMFGGRTKSRTDKDFPVLLLALIIGGLGYAMWRLDAVQLDRIGALAVIVFTFFFVTVSSRLVGIVGCSSNPISGMTIATLLATAMAYKIFVLDRAADPSMVDTTALKITCLSVAAIVCVAIATAGDCSQDLKTGYLVKATPFKQQTGEMIGVLTSVLAIAGVIILLANTYGFGSPTAEHPNPLLAPQAAIMKVLVDGVIGGEVPWTLIIMGGATAIIVEMLGLSALPFAVGMYLPLGLSTPIMVGGLIAWLIHRKQKEKREHEPGVLTSAGMVAGVGLVGVSLAGVTALISWYAPTATWTDPGVAGAAAQSVYPGHLIPWVWASIESLPRRWGLGDAWWNALPLLPFVGLTIWLWLCARHKPTIELTPPPVDPVEPPPPSDEPPAPDLAVDEPPAPATINAPPDVPGAPIVPPTIKPSPPSEDSAGTPGELAAKFSPPQPITSAGMQSEEPVPLSEDLPSEEVDADNEINDEPSPTYDVVGDVVLEEEVAEPDEEQSERARALERLMSGYSLDAQDENAADDKADSKQEDPGDEQDRPIDRP